MEAAAGRLDVGAHDRDAGRDGDDRDGDGGQQQQQEPAQQHNRLKRIRPKGVPDPDAEVIKLSPGRLITRHPYPCEVCNKGFHRLQNLQLHIRTHNLPWKLKKDVGGPSTKKVFTCPVPECIYNDPKRALYDLSAIKKHYGRKHGPKNLPCDCGQSYAIQADLTAHKKRCPRMQPPPTPAGSAVQVTGATSAPPPPPSPPPPPPVLPVADVDFSWIPDDLEFLSPPPPPMPSSWSPSAFALDDQFDY